MSRTPTAIRPQQVLQSYLDGLLQDAAEELAQVDTYSLDEFEAAVREEQVRDARHAPATAPSRAAAPVARQALAEPQPVRLPTLLMPLTLPPVAPEPPPPEPLPVAAPPVAKAAPQMEQVVARPGLEDRPGWAQESFECLLFDVAGLTLAVPLVCLGSIYPLAGQTLTALFGQPDWFLGILPVPTGNLKVLDTARWVMPERYRDDCREGLQYVISVEGYEWGLAVHQVSRSIRLDPSQIKWRTQRSQRPWLAGTVIEHMCALLDVAALAELIASGATRRMADGKLH